MLLIKNGHVKTMAGADLPRGSVLIGDDGKIAKVGARITAPKGCEVYDAKGALVTPGLVEAHCHIGLHNAAMRWEGADFNEKSDPVMPQLRAEDSIQPMDIQFEDAVKGGVTCVCTGPGSSNVVGGTFAVIKTTGRRVDDMIVKAPAAMKIAFGENPKNAFGQSKGRAPVTRMMVVGILREWLYKAKAYMEEKESGKPPKYDIKLEALIPVLKKEIPLKAHCHRADDIFSAIRVAKEFDVDLTLDHCTEGHLIAEEIAKEGYPALIGPTLHSRNKPEVRNKSFATPGVLDRAGMKVAIITDAPVIPLEFLPLCAGLAVAEGRDYEQGWKAVTRYPAEILGVSDRVGTLEPGKDGDLVVWTADPLTAVGARSALTVIGGNVVYKA
ncbi:MAG: amidohydrolase [Clostridia bacterium]|nr:amidohydrolase [Clostridia bacterium]